MDPFRNFLKFGLYTKDVSIYIYIYSNYKKNNFFLISFFLSLEN